MQNSGYWIFNCDPRQWEIDEFLKDGNKTSTWKVTGWQKDNFQKGQLGLIRVGVDNRTKKELKGKEKLKSGIYAIVEVLGRAKLINDEEDKYWIDTQKQEESVWRVEIKYIKHYLNNPILVENLINLDLPKEDLVSLRGRRSTTWAISQNGFNKTIELRGHSKRLINKLRARAGVRSSLRNSIDNYIKICKNSNWIFEEAYKFEFANYVNNNVNWNSQTDNEVLEILINSQKIKYTGNERGIQFILKSGREKLSKFISIDDVKLFRQIYNGNNPERINWENRGMSYTVLSAWLSSLFPEKLYPVPTIGFNETIKFLFDTQNDIFPKRGSKYLFACQLFMEETENILRLYPIEELCLKEWNKYYEANPELNIKIKKKFSKIDWIWIVQDFHLFVYREILGLYKKESQKIIIKDDIEPTAIEGATKLARHMRFERNSGFIREIKKRALEENRMLNCEVCGFSFLSIYGEIGAGFIEAHHKNPLGEREGATVTNKDDIALVCSNCHRMLHRGKPVYLIEELKEKMNKT